VASCGCIDIKRKRLARLYASISNINHEAESQSAVAEELEATMEEIGNNAKELAKIGEENLRGIV
jgi:methyl-accepting chemotaxis protein